MDFPEMLLTPPRFYTGLAEFLGCLLFIIPSQKRFSRKVTALLLLVFAIVQILFQLLCGIMPLWFWVIGMITAVLIMGFFVLLISKYSLLKCIHYTLFGFIMAEFFASIEWQLYAFIFNATEGQSKTFDVPLMIIVFSALFSSFLFIELFSNKKYKDFEVSLVDTILVVFISLSVFTISNLSFLTQNTPFSTYNSINYIRTLVDLLGVAIFYIYRIYKVSFKMGIETQAMSNILHKNYDQYRQFQNTIEIFNQKYHDFKHQIATIRLENDSNKREQYLEELENNIKSLNVKFNTGNDILDNILASKGMICIENNITFTCVVDGFLLNEISIMDLCAIFGNALDNAISAVKKTSEIEKRVINVAVFAKDELVIIRFENYYESEIIFKDGSFITTKNDQKYHGFGIKSIQNIVSKYDGQISIDTNNNWFKLIIMLHK